MRTHEDNSSFPNKKPRQHAAQVDAGWVEEGELSALDAAEAQLDERRQQLGISLGLKGLL